jgi:gamma-glutamylputrescine oxidase
MSKWPPQDQSFWYLKRKEELPCRQDLQTDVVIIGGGMAGLSAAQSFHPKGKKVVLLEQYYCGSGASGKSSGFITPNAELSFTEFSKKFTPDTADTIWHFINGGVEHIQKTIKTHNLNCSYNLQDTLILATSKKGFKSLKKEYENLSQYNYPVDLYSAKETEEFIGAQINHGSLIYRDTFEINGYAYCQELKKHLQKEGVLIYEETPATKIAGHIIKTPHATIKADYIIVCVDRFAPRINVLKSEVYHAQTFVMMSQVLTEKQIQTIFPAKKLLTWDTELIYNYFCITAQNRLILGGGSMLNTFNKYPTHNSDYMFNKLSNYFNEQFPESNIQFEQMWPGLIGISKDIMPVAGKDKNHPHIFYISAAAGLPIAAALGKYSAEHILDGDNTLQDYFSPYRSFPIGGMVQKIMGKQISFALSNLIKMNIP